MEEESEIVTGGMVMPAGSIKVLCPVEFVFRILLSGL
jgi:hypothetical protein